ncbi:MAG: quinolinate synthase NadA [Candidatus Tritonobacter lacicola]|nr:quinolinate synthase NadA [Candidatus Tritonobacter lacicola]
MSYQVELRERILELKRDRNAVILAHNYQKGEIQDIADMHGDSLALSRKAAETDADVIVFCGVHFMAESAAILSPDKTVLLPAPDAGCPLADMITADQLREWKKEHPGLSVVSYVNTSAAVKAESDICCTSSNAVKVVNSLPDNKILFCPDRNLGRYVQELTEKELVIWPGCCATHARLREDEVLKAKKEHPEALFVAHPECEPSVLKHADHITSTSGMFTYVKETGAEEYIIGTEMGILHGLKKENPGKTFILPSPALVCLNMKRITLPKLLTSLKEKVHVISVPEEIRKRAWIAVKRMIEIV